MAAIQGLREAAEKGQGQCYRDEPSEQHHQRESGQEGVYLFKVPADTERPFLLLSCSGYPASLPEGEGGEGSPDKGIGARGAAGEEPEGKGRSCDPESLEEIPTAEVVRSHTFHVHHVRTCDSSGEESAQPPGGPLLREGDLNHRYSCVTLDPKIKEATQTTNQIKCEWALTHPLSVI